MHYLADFCLRRVLCISRNILRHRPTGLETTASSSDWPRFGLNKMVIGISLIISPLNEKHIGQFLIAEPMQFSPSRSSSEVTQLPGLRYACKYLTVADHVFGYNFLCKTRSSWSVGQACGICK
ncbi:hypothetical protein TNCV_4197261 [Trichonephila clavipes]|nr:hypothetical protein TNCV_4197261 [Trichonephila clavipes]